MGKNVVQTAPTVRNRRVSSFPSSVFLLLSGPILPITWQEHSRQCSVARNDRHDQGNGGPSVKIGGISNWSIFSRVRNSRFGDFGWCLTGPSATLLMTPKKRGRKTRDSQAHKKHSKNRFVWEWEDVVMDLHNYDENKKMPKIPKEYGGEDDLAPSDPEK